MRECPPGRYFDNAAIGFPRPRAVAGLITLYLNSGGTYGRGAYDLALTATRGVEICRRNLASLLGAAASEQISFHLNATQALNTVLMGYPYTQGRVLVSPLEHNATMRPLQHLQLDRGLAIDTLSAHSDGQIDLSQLNDIDPDAYDLLIVNHVSNVNGVEQPIEALHDRWPSLPLLIDCSQSAGILDLKTAARCATWLAFSGHKGLHGPTGVGVLYSNSLFKLEPLTYGGTGSNSASLDMPEAPPARYEAGTPNLLGIIGLIGALEADRKPEHTLDDYYNLLHALQGLPGYRMLRPNDKTPRMEIFSLIPQNGNVSELARRLYSQWGIATRSGLHCAPTAHMHLRSFPYGSVRFSLSPWHTPQDLQYLQNALENLNSDFL